MIKDKNFYKLLFAIAIPITLQHMITTGVNLADTMMLGSFGETKISASSLANQFIAIHQVACSGLGAGASIIAARAVGAKNKSVIKKVITAMLHITIAMGLVGILACTLIPESVMGIYTNDPAIISEGARYLRWSSPSFIFGGVSFTTALVLRTMGYNNLPLISALVAFFVNISANYILIFGKLGAPALDIAGAAIGTAIARFSEFLIVIGVLLLKDKTINYKPRDFFASYKDILPMFREVSVPVIVSDTLKGVGNTVIAIIIGHISASFVAANAITMTVSRMATMFTAGVTSAAPIIIGQALGEGKGRAVNEMSRTLIILGIVIGATASAIILIIAGPMLQFYNIGPETQQICMDLMRAVAFIMFFMCTGSMLMQVMRGGGDTKYLMHVDLSLLWLVAVPLGYLCGIILHAHPFITYCALKSNQIVCTPLFAIRMKSGKWIKRLGIEKEG